MSVITCFTDLETDDIMSILLIFKLLQPSMLYLIYGEGPTTQKRAVAEMIPYDNIELIRGIDTERPYPVHLSVNSDTQEQEPEFQLDRIEAAILASSDVICIKPVRELLLLKNKTFPNTKLWFMGSFNLRACWGKDDLDEIIQVLQRQFPKVIMIESFTSIGEDNTVYEMNNLVRQVRKQWNEYMRQESEEDLKRVCTEISGIGLTEKF